VPTLYHLPVFLEGTITREQYVRWLNRKTAAHKKRDRGRGNHNATGAEYKRAIHKAVTESSGGIDAYTGEALNWSQISTYDNRKAKAGGRAYKALYAMLPTIDHIGDGTGPADFAICGWRTNDAKSDMTLTEFLDLCRKLISYAERRSGSG